MIYEYSFDNNSTSFDHIAIAIKRSMSVSHIGYEFFKTKLIFHFYDVHLPPVNEQPVSKVNFPLPWRLKSLTSPR